jgi:hypothetical protein
MHNVRAKALILLNLSQPTRGSGNARAIHDLARACRSDADASALAAKRGHAPKAEIERGRSESPSSIAFKDPRNDAHFFPQRPRRA